MKYTEVLFIIDRSGSMSGLEESTIKGYNDFLKEQKESKGEVLVTTVLFNHEYKVIHNRQDINSIKKLTRKDYEADGMTALLDAVGTSVNEIDRAQKEWKNKVDNTFAVIITDGMENASVKYDYADIKKLIKQKERKGWKFVFLGANIEAPVVAESIGINRKFARKYESDEIGTSLNYKALRQMICSIKDTGTFGDECFEEIDEYYKKTNKE